MKKNKLLLLSSLTVVACLTVFSLVHVKTLKIPFFNTTLTKNISIIPHQDKVLLENFFKHLLISERFAYTLYGDKPMSMSYCLHTHDSLKQRTSTSYPFTLEQWKTWEKHKHLFPCKNFALRRIAASKTGESWILLINKKRFLTTVDKHIKLFQTTENLSVDSQHLLHIFLTHPKPFKKAFRNRTLLKGILFGFGKNNSSLYHRKQAIETALVSDTSYIAPNAPFKSLQEELQHLTSQLRPFTTKDIFPISLPLFLADANSSETQALKKKYIHQRNHILPHLSPDTFLETTLSKLTSN